MKISFSTFACPEWSWADIYSIAKDLKFNGIEVRDENFSAKSVPFSDSKVSETIKKLNSLGLEIPCLSSRACLNDTTKYDDAEKEIRTYAKLAQKLNTPYIRIFADDNNNSGKDVDDESVIESLIKLVPVTEEYNVTLLIETIGVYSDTARLARIIAVFRCYIC